MRLARLVKVFEHPLTECYLLFVHACLPVFVNFNLLLQREDPILPLMYEAVLDVIVILLSRFLKPELVSQFRANPEKKFDGIIRDPANQLDDSKIHLGFGLRGKLTKALDEGDVTEIQYKEFLAAGKAFHIEGAIYAIKALPFDDAILKHAGFVDFLQKNKFSLESVDFIVERFQPYLNIPDTELPLLETEFALYQALEINMLSQKALKEASVRVCILDGKSENVTYRHDVLWYYIEHEFVISGSQRSKFHYLSNFFRCTLVLFLVLCERHGGAVGSALGFGSKHPSSKLGRDNCVEALSPHRVTAVGKLLTLNCLGGDWPSFTFIYFTLLSSDCGLSVVSNKRILLLLLLLVIVCCNIRHVFHFDILSYVGLRSTHNNLRRPSLSRSIKCGMTIQLL